MTTSHSQNPVLADLPPVRIRALGGLDIEVDGLPVRYGRTVPRKPLALLRSLLTLGGRFMSQHAACEALWPQADGYDAYRSLITTVYRLRQLLRHPEAVHWCGQGLALKTSAVWVDAWAFERELDDSRCTPRLAAALELYRGPFLGDEEHPHAFEARDRMQRKFVRGVRTLGERYESSGDTNSAIALYERALDAEAISEDIHRELMLCLIRTGQMSAAAQIYQRCRTLLARRLGISPSAPTVIAFRSITQFACDQRVTECA
jgi:DNA-binding SARP family transcriptional activator